ncbi:MAG: 2OG-Fe(II) oxygenase [Sphingomonas sp.]|uniref:2OG-Fe(II) oxygenase n=1 Tax=Sphingomonas sp. TaxID=28214 RepID=UPI001B135C35|nr:2OG-Fe(II) oxygenase [Sphingomonas sp.]MBO9623888.1 2OG-Fe(II) oxygenase [Sphingomonas sp.]
MALLEFIDLGGYRCLSVEQCREAGRKLAEAYRLNDPFPHIIIDELFDPELLRRVVDEFPDNAQRPCFLRDQERLKFQIRPDECSGAVTRALFAELNATAFLAFLSEMTGIEGLIADPYFAGAGLHETKKGGHLSIHADFPCHEAMRLDRRLNLLIYLNDDWEEGFGGALELWDRKMQCRRKSISPSMARAVIFSTERDTFHGHPEPLACPEGRSRRSIATYYYTAPVVSGAPIGRTTDFRPRPGSADKRDWRVMLHHLKADWVPPVLQRWLNG